MKLQPWESEWIAVAKRVCKGEFDRSDRSRLDSVAMGLKQLEHPTASRAKKRIEKLKAQLK